MSKNIVYERLREVPSFVKSVCRDHGGILVGGAALFLIGDKERARDWDIIVPAGSWAGVSKLFPYRSYTNTFGGVTVATDLFKADVWAEDMVSYFATMNPNYSSVAVNLVTQQVITATRRDPNKAESSSEVDTEKEELRAALRTCLHVIEKGIEVRMMDQWPVLKQVLPQAKEQARKALGMEL